jgi:hypothetical protein
VPVDRDAVVVVQGDQLAQAPVGGQGGGLVADALHHAPVAEDAVGVVVDDLGVGLVEARGQVGLGDGQADGVADALAEGAGRHLDTGGDEVLRVAGGLRAPLTERLEVVHLLLRVFFGRGGGGG